MGPLHTLSCHLKGQLQGAGFAAIKITFYGKASLIVFDLPSGVSIIGRRSKQEQLEVKYASGLAAIEHSGEEAG